jgi:arylformamidase
MKKWGITMWKNLTQEQLDRAYNNSLAVENSAEIIDGWIQASAKVRGRISGDLDISYDSDPRQSYDYFSAGVNAPIIVFIHGGYWQFRCKDDFTFIVPPLIELGISVCLLGYRLAPQVKLGEIILDIRNGLDALEGRIREERGSFPGFCLVGWSAGAHLVASVLDKESVNTGIGISGVYDLEPIRYSYLNEKLQLDEESSNTYSPILWKSHFDKPINLFVGGSELPEIQAQTMNFYEYRKMNDQSGSFKVLNGLNHYTIFDSLMNPAGHLYKNLNQMASNF